MVLEERELCPNQFRELGVPLLRKYSLNLQDKLKSSFKIAVALPLPLSQGEPYFLLHHLA